MPSYGLSCTPTPTGPPQPNAYAPSKASVLSRSLGCWLLPATSPPAYRRRNSPTMLALSPSRFNPARRSSAAPLSAMQAMLACALPFTWRLCPLIRATLSSSLFFNALLLPVNPSRSLYVLALVNSFISLGRSLLSSVTLTLSLFPIKLSSWLDFEHRIYETTPRNEIKTRHWRFHAGEANMHASQ